MSETFDPLSDRACRMMYAYKTGIELRETLRVGACLQTAVSDVTLYMEHLEDGYPSWHPAPHSFKGVLRLFIYREITGDSYRALETYQELAWPFGLEHIPDESVISRAWWNRFGDGVREYVTVAAHFVVKEINDHGPAVSAVRPKEDVIESDDHSPADDEESSRAFSDEQIHRTTRLAHDHGFEGFDSGRAENASYEDTQSFELQTYGDGRLWNRSGGRSVQIPTR